MSTVTVQPYDPEWPRTFERIRDVVWPVVQHATMRMEHIGSTAVPGLCAKPVIDICLVVASPRDIPYVVKALATIDYVHRGDLGIADREAFRHPPGQTKHHLYVSPRNSLSLKNQLGVRDYLRTHPDSAAAYGALKEQLARQFPHDVDRYTAGKTDFICSMLRAVGLTDDEVASIALMNRAE
ncbi:MAG: GrpB family protein [Gemmatimonadaceae bacterium]|nr:GrpB family protein [Gemmatimonadaceae bacterium]